MLEAGLWLWKLVWMLEAGGVNLENEYLLKRPLSSIIYGERVRKRAEKERNMRQPKRL
jgi:hypothetical protein